MRRPWLLTVPLAAIGLSGCGGSGGNGAYSLSATKACLNKAGLQTAAVSNDNFPAATGNLRVQIRKPGQTLLDPQQLRSGIPPNEYVFLVFSKTPAAALATEQKAVNVAFQSLRVRGMLITRAALRNDVGLDRNVFYYSTTGAVTKGDKAKFISCLR